MLRSPPWLGWPLWNICVTNDHGYVSLVSASWSFHYSWFITGFVTRLTQRVSLVEQELPTLPEHLSSPPVISGVCVTQSLVLCVCFVDRCLSFCPFSFGRCVVCSSIYSLWLPIWYLQILLIFLIQIRKDMLYLHTSNSFDNAPGCCKTFAENIVLSCTWLTFVCFKSFSNISE